MPSLVMSFRVAPAATPASTRKRGHRGATLTLSATATRLKRTLSVSPKFQRQMRRRLRRRSATTDAIITQQHVSALSAASSRSDGQLRQEEVVQRAQQRQLIHTTSHRSAQVSSRAGIKYLVGLAAFFFTCDYDEDGELSRSEFQVMMEILRHPSSRRRRTRRENSNASRMSHVPSQEVEITSRHSVSLEDFIEEHGHQLHHDGVKVPSGDFVNRLRRLKRGFRRCDTNGDNALCIVELEIALQKLDLLMGDEELEQLVQGLDMDGDGVVEWSEMVRAAWLNIHLGPARNRNSMLLLDALADVPASAIVNRPLQSHSSTLSLARTSSMTSPKGIAPGTGLLTRLALKAHLIWQQDSERRDQRNTSEVERIPASPKSRVEHFGARIITRISMHQVATMKKAGQGHQSPQVKPMTAGPTSVAHAKPPQTSESTAPLWRTKLSPSMRRNVSQIESIAVMIAAIVGVVCGLMSMKIELYVPRMQHQDEFTGDATYFLYLTAINIGVSLIEVNLMYLTAVVCAFRMTVATRLTLYPQDPEREFLTRAIARAALQIGHRKDRFFGIDPMQKSPRFVLWCSFLVFRSKRYILKVLIKLFIRRVLWRAAAKTILSAIVLPINAILNGWTLRLVMRHCRVTIIGPPCVTALLEEFLRREDMHLLPYQRVDYLRVLGCVVVCNGCVHPNLEIMVNQLRQRWVQADGKWPTADGCSCLLNPNDACEVHQLDNIDRFLASLLLFSSQSLITATEQRMRHESNMFVLLIIAFLLGGTLSLGERRLHVRACEAAGIRSDWPAVRRLKNGFISGRGVTLDGVYAIIHKLTLEEQEKTRHEQGSTPPLLDVLLYVGERISSLLSI